MKAKPKVTRKAATRRTHSAIPNLSPSDRYAYRVLWSEEDNEFVGLCAELPSLSWLAPTRGRALKGIVNMVTSTVSEMRGQREQVPEPIATKQYSGAFKVRIPPRLHADLALEAAESNVSLNRVVSMKLAGRGR
jgi:predicted HicB family RNase H-like nuclease